MKKIKKLPRRIRRNRPPLWWKSLSKNTRNLLITCAGATPGDNRKKTKTLLYKKASQNGIRSLLMMQPKCTLANVDEIFYALRISEWHVPQSCPICTRRQLGKSLAEYTLSLIVEQRRLLTEHFEKLKTTSGPPVQFSYSDRADGRFETVLLPVWEEILVCESIEKYLEGAIAAAKSDYKIYPRETIATVFLKFNPQCVDPPAEPSAEPSADS